jgi:MarR family 2-MHQ and catechol resistance regulon transcriptional repressor
VTATLELRHFVRRHRDPADRRVVVVDLTATGRELVERLFPEHSDRVTRAFGALDEGEKRSLAELCRKLAA